MNDWPLWDVHVDRLPLFVVKAPNARWAERSVTRHCMTFRFRGRPHLVEPTKHPEWYEGWVATDGGQIGDVVDRSGEVE